MILLFISHSSACLSVEAVTSDPSCMMMRWRTASLSSPPPRDVTSPGHVGRATGRQASWKHASVLILWQLFELEAADICCRNTFSLQEATRWTVAPHRVAGLFLLQDSDRDSLSCPFTWVLIDLQTVKPQLEFSFLLVCTLVYLETLTHSFTNPHFTI